jgi:GT2 family glycosyltransferase
MATNRPLTQKTAIIVPTLGKRPEYLEACIHSILSAGDSLIVIVSPAEITYSSFVKSKVNMFVIDPTDGLAAAINYASSKLPPEIEYFNWLGDDDLLVENSIALCVDVLEKNTHIAGVYGQCEYIDQDSNKFGANLSGQWASNILRFGPDLIPQPGALFRLEAFKAVGGLDTRYKLAFDFDLLIKLKSRGELHYLPQLLGRFRWHSDSLSVGTRWASVIEASHVRKSHLPFILNSVSFFWEMPLVMTTYLAGLLLSSHLKFKG